MTLFLWLPHHVEDRSFFFHIEIEIHFHTALMGMARHGIPQAAFFQFGQPHGQLAVSRTSGTMNLLMVRRLLVAASPMVCGEASASVIFLFGKVVWAGALL